MPCCTIHNKHSFFVYFTKCADGKKPDLTLFRWVPMFVLVFTLIACQSVQKTEPPNANTIAEETPHKEVEPPSNNAKIEQVIEPVSTRKKNTASIYKTEEDVFEKASPENIADTIMAEFNLRRGNLEDAYERYFRIAQATEDKKAIKRAADIAVALGDLQSITQASAYWLTLDNKEPQAYSLQYETLISTGQVEQASHLLAQAIDNKVSINFLNQEIDRNSREVEKAKNIYSSLILLPDVYRQNANVLIAEARLDFIQGRFEQAINKAEKVKSIQGKANIEADVYLIIAFSQNQTDQSKKAITTLEEGLKYHSNNIRLLTPLLDFLLAQGEFKKSQSYFEDTNLETHQAMQLAMNYIDQMVENNFINEALVQLQQVDYQSSGLADQFHYLRASALILIDRKEEALTHLLKTQGILKTNATQQAAGWMYDLGNEEQINAMVAARIENTDNIDIVLEVVALHEEFQRLDLADELLSFVLQKHPTQDHIRYKRALITEQRGLWAETELELNYLIQKNAQNPQYINALGYMLLHRPGRVDEAMLLIKSAYSLSKDDPAIIDSLGWGYFLQGETKLAIIHLKKAWDLLKDPEIGAHLGEVLWQLNTKKANEIWQKSLELDENHKVLLETIQRLNPNLTLLQNSVSSIDNTDVTQEIIQ